VSCEGGGSDLQRGVARDAAGAKNDLGKNGTLIVILLHFVGAYARVKRGVCGSSAARSPRRVSGHGTPTRDRTH